MNMRNKMIISSITFFVISSFINPGLVSAESTYFSDLNSDHPNYDAIMYLAEEGIIAGYPDGTIKPDNEITRAELLKIIVEANYNTPATLEFNRCFTDVVILDWYVRYICYAKNEGWVEGYDDGSFKPGNKINNLEVFAMLFDSMDFKMPDPLTIPDPFLDVEAEEWYAPYLWFALENGVIDYSEYYNPGDLITRGEAFEILARTLLYYEEISKPVKYSEDNLSFEYLSSYKKDLSASTDGVVLFANDNDDGIAFIKESQFEDIMSETGMSIEDFYIGSEGRNIKISVKNGIVKNVYDYNLLEFSENDITLFFKVLPRYEYGEAYYVIGHYTNEDARIEVMDMISSIEVK